MADEKKQIFPSQYLTDELPDLKDHLTLPADQMEDKARVIGQVIPRARVVVLPQNLHDKFLGKGSPLQRQISLAYLRMLSRRKDFAQGAQVDPVLLADVLNKSGALLRMEAGVAEVEQQSKDGQLLLANAMAERSDRVIVQVRQVIAKGDPADLAEDANINFSEALRRDDERAHKKLLGKQKANKHRAPILQQIEEAKAKNAKVAAVGELRQAAHKKARPAAPASPPHKGNRTVH